MQQFLTDVMTPHWWLSVVAVGLSINLAATYVRPVLDKITSSVSARRRTASEQRRRAFEVAVAEVEVDRELQLRMRLDSIYHLVRSIVSLVLGMGCMTVTVLGNNRMAAWIFTVIGSGFMAIALSHLRRCDALRTLLGAASEARQNR